MLDDLSYAELENFEHQLYSQVYHSTCEEYNVSQLDPKSIMPRNKVSYKPVRYFPRRKNNSSSGLQEKQRPKALDLRDNQKHEPKSQSSQTSGNIIHPYPINNILVFPQNSDTLINVISKNKRDFSYKKIFRKMGKQKAKTNYSFKNIEDSDHDVKPNINEIKLKNTKKPANVNRHTIILSDSEDDNISFEASSNNKKTIGNFKKNFENKNKNLEKNDITFSTDDDVILVENETVNDVIEIDDCNTEQMTPQGVNNKSDECNDILSTPESSASNDFLETSPLHPNQNFNFSLHGSEFKDSEFLRPTVNIDISETGSISSISDISSSMKTNVFSLVEFPKEKVNLFDENNLEKFKNSITPKRNTKKTVMDNHHDLNETDNICRNDQLPTLSDIGNEENSRTRERGRSIIRELVNDRAYVLLSSAEKKMKIKKRKSKDSIIDSIYETDLSENTALETSKKKKRKKYKRRDDEENDSCIEVIEDISSTRSLDTNSSKNKKHDLSGIHDVQENTEDYENGKPSNRIMIRTDLFSNTELSSHDKNKKGKHNGDEEILEKSEISPKLRKRKMSSEHKVNTTDPCKKNRKDKKVSGYIENDKFNEQNEILNKSHKNEKKNVQNKNDEQIELNDEVNTKLVEKRRKRKKDQSMSETEVIDNTNAEISVDACSVSKRKHKKKRLSENEESEVCRLTKVKDYEAAEKNCDILNEIHSPVLKPERIMRQKTSSSTDTSSEGIQAGYENLLTLTNLKESKNISLTDNIQKVDGNELNNSKCKHKKNLVSENEKNEKRDQAQVVESDITSKVVEISPPDIVDSHKNLSSSDLSTDDHKVNEKIEFVKNHNESINNTHTENITSVENTCTEPVLNSSSGITSEEVEHGRKLIDGDHSTKSISSEVTCGSFFMKENNSIRQITDKNCDTVETPHSVWNAYPTKFFSSSQSLFTVSNISIETNLKKSCDQEKIQDSSVSTSLISSVSTSDNSKKNFLEPSSKSLSIENKPTIQAVEGSCTQSTEHNFAQSTQSKISTTFTCNVENSKIGNLIGTSLQDKNPQSNVLLDNGNEKSEHVQPEEGLSKQSLEQVVVKIEPEDSDGIGHAKKQESKVSNTTKSNFPFVSSSMESERDVSTLKGKLPEVIENIISKKDNVSSMRKLCEFLEEVDDPQDVLKKVSLIKKAFLAKSVNTDVKSCVSMEEHVNDNDDILSISSDNSSIVCVDSETTIIDIIDDITLINCESGNSTLIEEMNITEEVRDLQGKKTLGKSKTILTENNPAKESDTMNLDGNDIRNDTERYEPEKASPVLRNPETGNYKRGLNKYDVEVIQQYMSDDHKLWEISSDDLPHMRYIPKGKRCIKCREIGHLGNMCPNKSIAPRCILCGVEGHLDFKCPNRICTQCGRKSSIMKSICQHCRHYRNLTCSLCKMRGHPRHKCPDLWRRYHLTVEPGPPVKPEGVMKLKEKENLWCSHCAKSGHLEHYCFSAKKNRNFQQLNPIIRHYIDIYGEAVNNSSKNISENTVKPKTSVVSETEKTSKNIPDQCEVTPDVTKINSSSCELSQIDVTTPSKISSDLSQNETTPEGETSLDTTLRNSPTPSSNVEIDRLPEDFLVIDEVFDETPNQNSKFKESVKEPNEFMKVSNDRIIHKTQSDISSSINEQMNKIDPKKSVEETELSTNSESSKKSQLMNEIDSSDIYNFFRKSEITTLKNYLSNELEVLRKSTFKVKNYYYRFLAYREDNCKPSYEWKIPSLKKENFNKELNMMLFGREQLKAGGQHYNKLVMFVNTFVGFASRHFRDSLFYSYEYIFSKKLHTNVNYEFVTRLLLKKYPNKTI